MPKTVFEKVSLRSTKLSFVWVLGIGFKRYKLNQDGRHVVQVAQTFLPFCMIETVQILKRVTN